MSYRSTLDVIKKVFSNRRITEINIEEVQEFRKAIADQGVKDINGHLRNLRAFLNWCAEEKYPNWFPPHIQFEKVQGDSRDISDRLRFFVMRRDHFKCQQCGRSPANEPGVVLVVDHIKPWSEGGKTVIDNLQTLCRECNAGKGDLS
jgi:hypothetical protein